MQRIRIAIVGLGKIAREEHVPALRADGAYELVAAVGHACRFEGVPCFETVDALFRDGPAVNAVAVCTPPQTHFVTAKSALEHGCHVLLEKPPCTTVQEFDELIALAGRMGTTLFQTWHARETPVVEQAAAWLRPRKVLRGQVVWKEDVRHWHPHQAWIWRQGGFGVMDAGINAVSILARILPLPIEIEAAHLLIPENCETPIAAAVRFRTTDGALIDADFDFRHPVTQDRTITIETSDDLLELVGHGAELKIGHKSVAAADQLSEYAELYRHFCKLTATGRSDADKRPLELVCDIFRLAGRSMVAAFHD